MKKPSTEHTRGQQIAPIPPATSLAPSTCLAQTVTIEARRKPPALATPQPIPPAVLDPAYIPLPPSPRAAAPVAPDPPVKTKAVKAAESGKSTYTKQPPAHDEQVMQSVALGDEQDELPSASNAQRSATPPKPSYSLFSVPSANASMSSLYVFTDKRVPRNFSPPKKLAPNEDGVISSQDALSPQPIQQGPTPTQVLPDTSSATPDRPRPPSPLCRTCLVQPKFRGFDYCSKTCTPEAERKKRVLPAPSRPKAPVTFAKPLDDPRAGASAFSPYSSERQSTPDLDSYVASSTAATSGQPVAEPAGLAGAQSLQAPTGDPNQAYIPLAIDSEALGDFMVPPRLYQQINDSSSSERGAEPRIGGYGDQKATFGLYQANEQPIASGAHAPGTPVVLTARSGDERSKGSTSYLPLASSLAPPPVVETVPPVEETVPPVEETVPALATDDGLIMSPPLRLPPRDTRAGQGRSGDRFSLIKKWANLGSDLRKGKNKD
ncbi:hypothetical protein M407DRAFT_34804 [Tulasnella calospora MUT 4182]|uniref:Uncharacterized protein n=1 Tax=Tulasnella calospora MUT 4182 TaxID=1051891 RepID=A0A0C3Q017_9AGAM|nr:hypothetical protein M407DRAFT_34804 [Tulasnella calospora MUT 4182]